MSPFSRKDMRFDYFKKSACQMQTRQRVASLALGTGRQGFLFLGLKSARTAVRAPYRTIQ